MASVMQRSSSSLGSKTAMNVGEKVTERVSKLRNILLKTVPEISAERVRYYTESYRENEDEPPILKRAKAFQKMLRNMSISILDGELLVGTTTKYPRGVELFPEYDVEWIERELAGDPYDFDKRPGDRYLIKEDARQELKELLKFWHGKTHKERVNAILPENVVKAVEMAVIDSNWLMVGGEGHITVNFRTLLSKGADALLEEVALARSALDLTGRQEIEKKLFYDAATITLEAMIEYAERYSSYVRDLSREESDPVRKTDLERIAEVCSKVPRLPAENFHEALQSIWFIQALTQIESNGHSISLGRLDQTLYRYFESDLEAGTRPEEIAELLQCFWLKLSSVNKIRDWYSTQFFSGYQVFQNMTIGGQLEGGRDAGNTLSFMMLGVQKGIRLTSPSMSLRYFDGTSEDLLRASIEVIRVGGGQPALYSDECVIPALVNRGIEYQDALNWSVVGCVEPIIEGKESTRPRWRRLHQHPQDP